MAQKTDQIYKALTILDIKSKQFSRGLYSGCFEFFFIFYFNRKVAYFFNIELVFETLYFDMVIYPWVTKL